MGGGKEKGPCWGWWWRLVGGIGGGGKGEALCLGVVREEWDGDVRWCDVMWEEAVSCLCVAGGWGIGLGLSGESFGFTNSRGGRNCCWFGDLDSFYFLLCFFLR